MSRNPALVLLVAVSASTTLAACASLLGYDDLVAQEDPAQDTGVGDTAADGGGYHPRARPPGEAKPSGKGKTLWLQTRQVVFGTLDATGKDSTEAWKEIGFDLDGRCTGPAESAGDIDTCKKAAGAAPDVLVDGSSCRDNNFAGKLLQQVKFARLEERTNSAIKFGNNTWILALDDLDDGENDPYVVGRLYKATRSTGYPTAPPPKFDGSDVRQVTADSLVGTDLAVPKTIFPKGYLSNNVWVSGEPAKIDLMMPLDSMSLTVPLTAGVMTVEVSSDHTTGGMGTFAGAIPQGLAQPLLDPIARSMAICPGTSFYDSLINGAKKLVDVVIESPTLQDPTVSCNGMSFGIAFLVAPLKPVTSAVAETPLVVDKCGDGGV